MDTAETDENVPTLESMAAEVERLTVAGSLSWCPMGTDRSGRYLAIMPDGAPTVELKCHRHGSGLRFAGGVVEPSSALIDAVMASSEAWVKRQAARKRQAVRDALIELELASPVEVAIVCGGSLSDEIRAQECVSCDFRWFGGGDAPEHYENGPEVEPVPVPSGWTCSACGWPVPSGEVASSCGWCGGGSWSLPVGRSVRGEAAPVWVAEEGEMYSNAAEATVLDALNSPKVRERLLEVIRSGVAR